MTEYPYPLIMIIGWVGGTYKGIGGRPNTVAKSVRERQMRIIIYKVRDQVHEYLLVPGRRAHMSPVRVRGRDKERVREDLETAIAAVSVAETPSLPWERGP